MEEDAPQRERPTLTQDPPCPCGRGVRTCPPNSRGGGSAEAARHCPAVLGRSHLGWWAIAPFLNCLGTDEAWLALVVKNPPANAGHVDSIAGSGRSPGGGSGNPLQYSCLENPMDRGTWWATVWTQLKQLSTYAGTRRPWDSQTGRIRVDASESRVQQPQVSEPERGPGPEGVCPSHLGL